MGTAVTAKTSDCCPCRYHTRSSQTARSWIRKTLSVSTGKTYRRGEAKIQFTSCWCTGTSKRDRRRAGWYGSCICHSSVFRCGIGVFQPVQKMIEPAWKHSIFGTHRTLYIMPSKMEIQLVKLQSSEWSRYRNISIWRRFFPSLIPLCWASFG